MSKPIIQTTGRRKRSVARVRLRPGTGTVTVNGRPVVDYFPSESHRLVFMEPLRVTATEGTYDIDATLHGGGVSGQAGALRLGIARALEALESERRPALKEAGFLTRDDRKKESKKYGLKKARKAPQYSKR
ncbi:MAG TPA: 30S ribosomal protein S9 [Acidimicrobiales bacterium]|jgi:small subunit ribosomal protein S9|nr:30S ribosomal protein S9 [Acidimicrobiaceae bacterium]MDP6176456.1 30S ribosomal protein S9 [Acidimicrobiales bacterium]MDP6281953.1 30S ribosomal protein S9 [Acidimicrobiales bacterium]MDP7116678.1 30S ribosomal protein S9 [Acidimicrobiales bacterium]MDP7410657.1 30S ribosomal protein S9 [Acidimicrobiales bacterium]|tara:strand:+ start:7037 stop:7429 length:393 start_codon:yes stop_codon:yes gene_type:complete